MNTGSGAWIAVILLVLAVLQIAMIITFFSTAGHVRRVAELVEQRWAGLIRSCEFCAGGIQPGARVCMHCGRDIFLWTLHGGEWWARQPHGWVRLVRGRWEPPDDKHPAPDAPGPAPS